MRVPILSLAAFSAAAVLLTGCCGARHSKTASTTTTTSTVAETTPTTDRTYVSQEVPSEGDMLLYSEELKVGKREVEAGSVKVRKTVKTENVTQPVELRRETITIDREAFQSAQRAAAAGQTNTFGAAFQDKEIILDVKREEAVVEVSPYVSGKISAQKRSTTERQEVQRPVRREEVEVIKTGDSKDIIITDRVNQETK